MAVVKGSPERSPRRRRRRGQLGQVLGQSARRRGGGSWFWIGGSKGKVGDTTSEAPEEAESINENGVGDGGFRIGSESEVEKEKDHDSFSDTVTADADRKGGRAEDKDEDQAGEGVVDGEI